MTLPDYILQRGIGECARLFGVKPVTVYSWRRRVRYPRPEKANAIVRATQGAVTMDEIYGPRPQ